MDTEIAVLEWSPDGCRAYNPATRQSASATSASEVLKKVGSPSRVGLCLGRRVSFVRESHTPDTDKNEARLVVDLQMERLFAGIEDELAFDFMAGSHMHEDGRQTVVAAVPAQTLRTCLKQVASAGAHVVWVAPVSLGSQRIANKFGHDEAIVVENSSGHLSLDVVRHGSLIYSRSVVDPETPERRTGEVTRTLAASGIPNAATIAVNGVELVGGTSTSDQTNIEAMSAHSAQNLNIELPEAISKKVKSKSQTRVWFAAVLWVVVIVIAAFVYQGRATKSLAIDEADKKELARVRTFDKALKSSSSRLAAVNGSQANLDLAFSPSQPVYDVLLIVSNSRPEGIWLTGITHERGKPIQIRGTALRSEAVSEYTASLAINDRFRDVKLMFATNTEIESTPVVQFSIQAHVIGNFPINEVSSRRSR